VRRLAAGCLALLALVAGCGGDDGDEGAGDPESPTSVTAGPGGLTAADITPLSVELLEPGREPRSALAADLSATHPSAADFRFDLAIEGVTSAHVVGTSRMGAPSEVDDDGTAEVHYSLGGLDVALTVAGLPPTRAEDALAMNWQLVVGPDRGITSATVQTLTSGNLPGVETVAGSLDPRLTSLLLPFPAEPVGIGGQWRVEGSLPMFGSTVALVADLELVQRRGSSFVVAAALTITTPHAESTPDISLEGLGRLGGDLHQLGLRRGSVAMSGTIAQAAPGAEVIPMPLTLDVAIDQR
jgi:hypothetical protein